MKRDILVCRSQHTKLEIVARKEGKVLRGTFPYLAEAFIKSEGVKETFLPFAFSRSVKSDTNKFLLIEHRFEPNTIIANTYDQTLQIDADSKDGLEFTSSVIPDINIREYGISIGFQLTPNGSHFTMERSANNAVKRVIRDAELFEISLTRNPAYKDTKVKLDRSMNMELWQ